MQDTSSTAVPQAQLTLFRAICIIVGVIVGSGIFQTPSGQWGVAAMMSDWYGLSPSAWYLLVWIIGGVIALLGALCYAELATTYPRQGGDYVYLNRAFGPWCGFMFGWARLAVIQGGSIGAIAYVFGDYATRFCVLGKYSAAIYAGTATVLLTAVNVIGVREGSLTQNILTIVKVAGLAVVFLVAMLLNPSQAAAAPAAVQGGGDFFLAMVLIAWTYGGWNEIAYITAEVKNPTRNIARALIIGVAAVTLIYMLVNWAFLHSLGLTGIKDSSAVAADALKIKFGETGARAIAALIMVSALGGLNGFILTSARVYYAMGTEHRLLSPLGFWSKRLGTPVVALIVQGAIIVTLVIVFSDKESFQRMVYFTAAVFWGFIALTTIALVTLRFTDRAVERPWRVPLFPVVPIAFCAFSVYMVYRCWIYKPVESKWAVIVLAIGLPLYLIAWATGSAKQKAE